MPATAERWTIDSTTGNRQVVFTASDARRIARAWRRPGVRVTVKHVPATY